MSLTNEDGVRLDIQVSSDIGKQINDIIASIMCVIPSPHKSQIRFIQETALTAIADTQTLQYVNQGLVDKQKEARQKRTKKHFGSARMLPVAEALKQKEERVIKEN